LDVGSCIDTVCNLLSRQIISEETKRVQISALVPEARFHLCRRCLTRSVSFLMQDERKAERALLLAQAVAEQKRKVAQIRAVASEPTLSKI
jgi:hypothetical protein